MSIGKELGCLASACGLGGRRCRVSYQKAEETTAQMGPIVNSCASAVYNGQKVYVVFGDRKLAGLASTRVLVDG